MFEAVALSSSSVIFRAKRPAPWNETSFFFAPCHLCAYFNDTSYVLLFLLFRLFLVWKVSCLIFLRDILFHFICFRRRQCSSPSHPTRLAHTYSHLVISIICGNCGKKNAIIHFGRHRITLTDHELALCKYSTGFFCVAIRNLHVNNEPTNAIAKTDKILLHICFWVATKHLILLTLYLLKHMNIVYEKDNFDTKRANKNRYRILLLRQIATVEVRLHAHQIGNFYRILSLHLQRIMAHVCVCVLQTGFAIFESENKMTHHCDIGKKNVCVWIQCEQEKKNWKRNDGMQTFNMEHEAWVVSAWNVVTLCSR